MITFFFIQHFFCSGKGFLLCYVLGLGWDPKIRSSPLSDCASVLHPYVSFVATGYLEYNQCVAHAWQGNSQ